MSAGRGGRVREHRGWVLVETIHGWYACKGRERVRVGGPHEEHADGLNRRWVAVVDAIQDGGGEDAG